MQWPTTAAEPIAIQEELRGPVDQTQTGRIPQYVAGLGVPYTGDRLSAAVVVLDRDTLGS
jgi:deoxyribonuclease V